MNNKSLMRLLDKLELADDAYYNTDKPIMSDAKYDAKVEKLKGLDLSGFSKSLQSRTKKYLKKIGAQVRQSKRNVTLPFEIRSLEKVKTTDERKLVNYEKKLKKKVSFLSPKLDGASVTLKYTKGKLVDGLTRGDGTTGQSKIEHIKHIANVRKTVKPEKDFPKTIYVRCEGVLFLPTFDSWNKKEKRFTSDRNPIAGWLNSDTAEDEVAKHINLIGLDVTDKKGNPLFDRKSKTLAWLRKNNLVTEVWNHFCYKVNSDLKKWLDHCLSSYKKLPYLFDGVVFECEYSKDRLLLDEKKPKKPKYIYAYKTAASEDKDFKLTKVTDITFMPSKVGVLAPMIHFKPVVLGKSNVSKATGDNFSLLVLRGIGVGSKIKVVKAGGVIPKAYLYKDKYRVDAKKISPKKCLCGAKIVQPWLEMADGKKKLSPHYYCSKPLKCKYVQRARLEQAIKSLKLTGVGKKNIEALFDAGYNDLFDLLNAKPKNLLNLERFGEGLVLTLTKGLRQKIKEADKTLLMELSGVFTVPGLSLAKKSLDDLESGKLNEGAKYNLYKEKRKEYKAWHKQLKGLIK